MQERIESYLKSRPGVWTSSRELSEKLGLARPTLLHGLQRLFTWGVVEKKYMVDIATHRQNIVFVRLKK